MITLSIIAGIIGGQEIILILIVVLVLFGGKKIPELMRGLGRGMSEYQKAKNDIMSEVNDISKPLTSPHNVPVKKEEQAAPENVKEISKNTPKMNRKG